MKAVSNSQYNQFYKSDLDLDPMTFVLKFDLDVVKISYHTKNEVSMSRHSKVIAQTDRHTIGRSRGACPVHAPLQDPILSFSHTFSQKSAHVGGQNPPKMGPCPSLRKILDPALNTHRQRDKQIV